MVGLFRSWYHRYWSNSEVVVLILMILLGLFLVSTMATALAPVFASLVIAYVLLWLVDQGCRCGLPRQLGIIVSYLFFLSVFLTIMLVVMPMLWQQITLLLDEMPNMMSKTQTFLYWLPEQFPDFISKAYVDYLSQEFLSGMRSMLKTLLSLSLASIPMFIVLVVYLVLIPVLVLFFLKDRDLIVDWCVSWLPKERGILIRVWHELDIQLGNYIRGKVAQIFITGTISYLTFFFLHLKYSALLGFLIGLSVLIPYVGAALATFPVLLVALFQWGVGTEFYYVMLAYAVIQAFDGNVLVPLLFSEAVNLHPIAIILAVLIFGHVWGFWGVFFAIPLATLVNAILRAWPRLQD